MRKDGVGTGVAVGVDVGVDRGVAPGGETGSMDCTGVEAERSTRDASRIGVEAGNARTAGCSAPVRGGGNGSLNHKPRPITAAAAVAVMSIAHVSALNVGASNGATLPFRFLP
jgi:hypothetical protein